MCRGVTGEWTAGGGGEGGVEVDGKKGLDVWLVGSRGV